MRVTEGNTSVRDGDTGWEVRIRLGWVEFFTLFSMLAVAALLVPALRAGWAIALVPGLTYLLAMGAAYVLYRQYARERAQASRLATAVTFRVVDVRGVCPLGRRTGDLITVGSGDGAVSELCEAAQQVLRLAAASGNGQAAERWCCPIYEHLLVFQREPVAA